LKNFIKYILQKTFGLPAYLLLFARFVILKLPYAKYEKDFLRFINLIDDGGHVLDIGANIGAMTYYLSKRLPESGIHSFEPVTENLEVLRKIKNKFDLLNVKIYPFALGNKNEYVKMIMPQCNKVYFHGLSHIKQDDKTEKGKTYDVEVKKLDDVKDLQTVKINAIKIDVEEYEYNVLCGAKDLLIKNRPLIYCELWEGENREKSITFISSLKYKIFIVQNKRLVEFERRNGFNNFFFIPIERCNNLKL